MQWSKLRSTLEARFAPALRGRVTLHQARYRHSREEVGRIWLAVDGAELAAFPTGARWRQVRVEAERLLADAGRTRAMRGRRPWPRQRSRSAPRSGRAPTMR
jgi:hypothetical protein